MKRRILELERRGYVQAGPYQKGRTLEEMAGVKPKSAGAPRLATRVRNW